MKQEATISFTRANFNALLDQVNALKEEISFLKSQLNTDSHNSSKPPSSDGLKKKNVNLRVRSRKSSGGQAGHKGSTLKFEGVPDKVIYHMPFELCNCGNEYL